MSFRATQVAGSGGAADRAARQWTGRTRGGLVGNWIFAVLTRYCGPLMSYLLLVPVSFYFLFFAPKALRASQDYLARVGRLRGSWPRRMMASWRHFYTFGQALIDRVAVFAGNADAFHFETIGEEHIRNALAENKGMVVLGAHCGNMDIAGGQLAGLGVKINIVTFQGETARVRKFFDRVYKNKNFDTIETDGSADASIDIIAALSRGEVVAMRADRGLGAGMVEVPFLGAPALFPTGPFVIAAATCAPVISVFTMRQRKYQYQLRAYPAAHVSFDRKKDRNEQLRGWVAAFAGQVEEQLKAFPYQWYNLYDFWKTPTAEKSTVTA